MADKSAPIEWGPPYSLEFIADLHGDCYPPDITAHLRRRVERDAQGAQILDAMEMVTLELKLLAD